MESRKMAAGSHHYLVVPEKASAFAIDPFEVGEIVA